MGLKKPIQSVFLDVHLSPSGEEEGLRHSPAISTPQAELTGVKFPKVLGAGCCMESGDR